MHHTRNLSQTTAVTRAHLEELRSNSLVGGTATREDSSSKTSPTECGRETSENRQTVIATPAPFQTPKSDFFHELRVHIH